jgi:hypothetical protein
LLSRFSYGLIQKLALGAWSPTLYDIIDHILFITLFRRKDLRTPKLNGVPILKENSTMKYYRFSRRRKNYLFGLSDYNQGKN